MKKYIKPAACVMNVELSSLIAASYMDVYFGGTATSLDVRRRHYYIDDDDYWDEDNDEEDEW